MSIKVKVINLPDESELFEGRGVGGVKPVDDRFNLDRKSRQVPDPLITTTTTLRPDLRPGTDGPELQIFKKRVS